MNPKLVNYRTLSELTGIRVHTLRTLYRQGKISAIKLGHRTMFFDPDKVRAEIQAFNVEAKRSE
jgi:predicted site-specific integrase-resolvase